VAPHYLGGSTRISRPPTPGEAVAGDYLYIGRARLHYLPAIDLLY
jgi:hypothetical protein